MFYQFMMADLSKLKYEEMAITFILIFVVYMRQKIV